MRRTQQHAVAWVRVLALVVAGLDAAAALSMALLGNVEGVAGAALFLVLFGGPALMLAWLLGRRRGRAAAGWIALVLAGVYAFVVLANLSGYSAEQALLVAAIMIPNLALDLAVFTTCVVAG